MSDPHHASNNSDKEQPLPERERDEGVAEEKVSEHYLMALS